MQTRKLSASVFTALPDGTGVLLNIETLLYFSLNRTGATLWQEIERADTTDLEQLVHCACEQFQVDQASAQKVVRGFVEQLAHLGLVRIW
jgi:Coenzyme PQQ synthesis protein D (PqqD)